MLPLLLVYCWEVRVLIKNILFVKYWYGLVVQSPCAWQLSSWSFLEQWSERMTRCHWPHWARKWPTFLWNLGSPRWEWNKTIFLKVDSTTEHISFGHVTLTVTLAFTLYLFHRFVVCLTFNFKKLKDRLSFSTCYCLLIHASWPHDFNSVLLSHRPSCCPQSSPALRRCWPLCPCCLWTPCSTVLQHAGRKCWLYAGSLSPARVTTWRCSISIEHSRKSVEIRWVSFTDTFRVHWSHCTHTCAISAFSPVPKIFHTFCL